MGENNGKNLVIECFVLLLLKKNIEYVIIIKNIEKSLHISIFFPKYKASFDGYITEILKNDFGINKLFGLGKCDFSNVTDEPIACGGVIHKCSIEVTEKGIEGAAVTIIDMYGNGGPDEKYKDVYHDYIVDRAFGFVITDSYGEVLFSGTVNSVN